MSIKGEQDFYTYLNRLHKMLPETFILIVANNTPWGPSFTPQVSNFFRRSMGLQADLCDKFRLAYAAAIYRGNVVVEQLSSLREKNIDITISNSTDTTIRLCSAGFEGVPERNLGLIEVNGKNVSLNRRGLNFVVLNASTLDVVDSCTVDTFINDFVCYRSNDVDQKLKEYKDLHPDVTLVCMSGPVFPRDHLTENEKFIKTHGLVDGMVMDNIFQDLDTLITSRKISLLDFYPAGEEVKEVLSQPDSYTDSYGTRKFFDRSGKHVNTGGGIRVTHGQPKQHERAIFLVGNCCVFGVAASDEHTIASFLQSRLNEEASDEKFIVYNYGYYLMGGLNPPFYDEYKILQSLPVKSGDIVILSWGFKGDGVYYCDISQAAQRPHEYGEVFFCIDHYTPAGYHLIADKLYEFLLKNHFFPVKGKMEMKNIEGKENNEEYFQWQSELDEYKKNLREIYSDIKPRIGSVVMNCNPFTLGHRYLVETALQFCDRLIVFVVEEDKSDFPFQDRIDLVKKGLADLKNVVIVPSGNFIISTRTFAEYFNKSKLQDVKIDTSLDVTIFAKEIAPCLDISIRFVGTEPFDHVTAQYNESMNAILSQYGIEVKEIPRYEVEGKIVSASQVRHYMQDKQWEKIAELVPKTTLDYLKSR